MIYLMHSPFMKERSYCIYMCERERDINMNSDLRRDVVNSPSVGST